MKRTPWLVSSALLMSAWAPTSFAEQVYALHIDRGSNRLVEAQVSKVNATQFITDAALIEGANNLFIVDASVTPAAKLVASVTFRDEKSRLAVLTASNVTGAPLVIAKQPQAVSRQISLLTSMGKTDTVVQRLEPVKGIGQGDVYTHTVLYTDKQWAAPLVNNCGELLGFSLYESGVFNRMVLPETFAYAMGTDSLKASLTAAKIEFTEASDVCLSDVEQAEKAAEEARKKIEEAEKAMEEADAKAKEALEQAKQEAEAELEKQRLELENAKKEADELAQKTNDELEKARQELEQLEQDREKINEDIERLEQAKKEAEAAQQKADQQKLYLAVGAAVVIFAALLIFLLVLRKRRAALAEREAQLQQKQREASGLANEKQQLSAELAQMQRSFHDILLDGVAADGRQLRIKINGKLLAQKGSQVIGRESTQVDYAVAEAEISRKHVQLTLRDNRVYVEDLKSQNGSWLNDQPLQPHQPVELSQGSRLKLSSITFTVTYLE